MMLVWPRWRSAVNHTVMVSMVGYGASRCRNLSLAACRSWTRERYEGPGGPRQPAVSDGGLPEQVSSAGCGSGVGYKCRDSFSCFG